MDESRISESELLRREKISISLKKYYAQNKHLASNPDRDWEEVMEFKIIQTNGNLGVVTLDEQTNTWSERDMSSAEIHEEMSKRSSSKRLNRTSEIDAW